MHQPPTTAIKIKDKDGRPWGVIIHQRLGYAARGQHHAATPLRVTPGCPAKGLAGRRPALVNIYLSGLRSYYLYRVSYFSGPTSLQR